MTKIMLTKDQFWQIANLVEKYRLDAIQLEINQANGVGPNIYVRLPQNNEKIDITDYSSW